MTNVDSLILTERMALLQLLDKKVNRFFAVVLLQFVGKVRSRSFVILLYFKGYFGNFMTRNLFAGFIDWSQGIDLHLTDFKHWMIKLNIILIAIGINLLKNYIFEVIFHRWYGYIFIGVDFWCKMIIEFSLVS